LPDPTKRGKFHNIAIMPRDMIFYVEEIKPIKIIDTPKTFRRVFGLRFSRFGAKERLILGDDNQHFVVVNHQELEDISRKT
jgi:hypothetical protein